MSSLTLRLGTVRSSKATVKKKKECCTQKFEVKPNFLEELQGYCKSQSSIPAIKWLSDCVDTMDVLKQAGLIKQIGQSLQKGHSNSPDQVLLCCRILAYVYIGLETKNILKRTIASILQSCPEPLHPTIVQFLRDSLVDRIQTVSQETNDIHLRQMVDAITACLDNFSLGEQCIANAVTNVLQFSSHVLIMLTKKVREECSPLEATQHSQNLQAVIRSTVLSLQKCPATVRQLLESPDSRDFTLELLAHILHNVLTLLHDDAILLDCRMSCGMAAPLLLRYILGPNFFRTVFQVAFPSDSNESFCVQEQLNNLPADLDFSLSLIGALPVSSQLCLTNGLLSTLQDNELVEEMTPGCRPLLHLLLPQLLYISKSQNNTGSALTIACCRGILLWTQRACKALESCIETDSIYNQVRGGSAVSQQLLEFVWEHWEHFIDGVRHLTSDIFSNVIILHTLSAKDATEKSKFLEELIGHLLSLPWHRRSKYSGLCCLVDQIGACQILEFRSSIPQDLLDSMSDPSTASYASELFEKLFTVNFVELHDDISIWQQNWVTPVLTALCQGSKAPSLEHILSKLLKCCPETLQYITSILTEEDCPSSTTHLGALIMAIKTARNLGLVNSIDNEEDNGYEPLWNNILSLSLLKLALHHIDDQIRLDAFGLLCESQRSTELLTQVDIELIEAFLPVNMSNQSPAFRQQLISQVKKLIIRIHDGGRVIQKRISQIIKKDSESNEARNLESQIHMYQNFLIWLADLQFYCLHVGANFPRRGTALQILTLLHQLIGFQEIEGSLFSLKKCLTNENVQNLLECLRDTYETNKGLALNILATFPEDTLGFKSDQRVSELFEAALSLASSPRPSESVTAAYLFRLLVNFQMTWQISTSVRQVLEESSQRRSEANESHSNKTFSDYSDNDLSSNPSKDDIILVVLEVLMFQLQLELECAKNSLLEAAATAPMYGILFCTRLLLGDVELSIVAKDEHWRLFIVSLIETCFELSEVVSPVVNNSSPEGHLPMDTDPASLSHLNATVQKALGYHYDPFESYFPSNPDGDGDDVTIADIPPDVILKVQAVTAQMLLLCSWRTMKEVSLLLGFLCQKAPIASDSDNAENSGALLLRDQVLRIGEYFTTQLAETKHRGAFEQAYVGFCKMCTRLWSVPDQLHQLPAQWLRDLLDHLSCGVDSKLCSTRRSAGVPFMVQALVSSEPDVTGFSCLKEVLSTLLTFTLLPKYENTEARVHALNILRALFRDTRLGENVMPFIADGVKAAVLGFKGQTWAVRNSATLLFSALMTRIFGVKHGKDENSRKNCMTGRVFFQRFPTLHQFLLDELVSVSKNLQNSYNREQLHLQPSVYPVLLLLARLYPSPLEGTDSNLQLAAFLPHVKACSSSAIIQTRVLAAKALVPLVPLDMYHGVLEELIKVLPTNAEEVYSQNRTHGTLLQIHHLLKDISGIPEQVQARVIENLGDWLHSRLWICTRSNPCLLTRMAYLDLIESCLSKSLLNSECKLITEIQEHIMQEIERPVQDSSSPGEALFHVSIARLALHVALVLVDHADSSTNSQNEVHWSSSELSALSEAVGGSEMLGQHLLSPVQEVVPFFSQKMPVQTSPADSGSPAVMALQDLVIQLLMDRNYEVRLTALQWLRVLLQGDSISPDDDFVSSDETSLQFIKEIPPWLTSYSRGRLCAQLLTCSRDLVLMLVSMALVREQHPECLLEVYHVICLFPLAVQLPWPHPEESDKYLSSIEKLDLILQRGEAEARDDVRCALLRFSGSLVPQVYLDIVEASDDCEVSPRTVLEEWADAFLICCSPEQSLGTRMMAANILIRSAPYLLLDPHQVLGSSGCIVWCAAVRLLNDDEPLIKQKVAGIVKIFHLSSPSPGPDLISFHVQPVLALDLLISSFVEKFGEHYQTECLTTLLDWCLREDAKDAFSTIEEEDRLFDKGEMNIYAEEVTLTNIVIKHLKHLLRQVFGVRRLSRADFPNRMRATSSKITTGINSPSEEMEEDDKQFPESLTSDSLAILSMPANVKNAVMTNFTIPTSQVSPWLSKTENASSNVPEGDVFLLRDVVSMIAEELAIMLAEIPPLTNQTPFVCRHYERQILQTYRRVVAVTSLAKYDTSQLDIMNQLEATLQDIFGRTVPHVNHLVQTMFTEIWKVTHVLANA